MRRYFQYFVLALALVFVQVSCVTTSTSTVEVSTESSELLKKIQAIPEVVEVKILSTSDHFKEHYEIWFEQKVDPSKEDSPTFKQRVLLAHASNDAPVIVELQGYEIHTPRSGELATMFKGNQLTIEHRFFANSKPEGEMPWYDLTVKNAAHDQHKIITAIKKAIYPDNKYISTGISKGGQTTMLHRSYYPKDVDISVCYVAPLNFEREDPRIYHFFDTIGTEAQRKQIEDCLAGDADGLIVSAISNDGLEDLVKIAADRGIPVLDLVNGMSSTYLDARVAADYGELGSKTATYLRKLHHDSDQPVRVAWFPGPEGAAWVDAGNAGFSDALKGSPIEIVSTSMGDTGHATQSRLLEIVLDEHADELDYIVGTAVTAEAAADVLRRRGLSKSIQVLSYYYSPGVHRGIKRGNIIAAPSDQTALQARIAVDVMVRMLEKQDYFKHVAPRIVLIDGGKLRGWDSSTTLAPRGFRPIFSINN